MSLQYVIFNTVVFSAVMLLLIGLYSYVKSARLANTKRVRRRLMGEIDIVEVDNSNISISKNRVMSNTPVLQKILIKIPFSTTIDKLLTQSGMKINVAKFCLYCVLSGIVTAALLMLLNLSLLVLVLVSTAALGLPLFVIFSKRSKRIKQIEAQLPDALEMMSRGMRAGHALPSAIKMVGDDVPNPLGGEFRMVFDEVNFGVSIADALKNMTVRVPSMDLGYFVVAVLIQRETGGNLTELLGKISVLVRERIKLLGSIRTLTAEGRVSAIILTVLPFVIAGALMLVSPDLMKLLWTDPTGINMLIGTAVWMVFGILWMRKLIRIRV
jgi:tight adherence protein B